MALFIVIIVPVHNKNMTETSDKGEKATAPELKPGWNLKIFQRY